MAVLYKNFVMRLHNENASASSWELAVGENIAGTFGVFKLGNVVVPNPPPKTDSEDVPGTNGLYDLSEASGRVYYQRRTITVPLLFIAGKTWTDTLETTLARYNGRVCDFAFSTYDAVAWTYTGRLTVTKNRAENNVVLTFDAEPFATSTTETVINVPTRTNIDANSFGWTLDEVIYGTSVAQNNSAGKFDCAVSQIGAILVYKRTGLTANTAYTLGVKSIIGGEIAFYNNGVENKTKGVVDSNGVLKIRVTVDGSFYTWQTVGSTTASYPSFKCEYLFALAQPDQTFVSSNVIIRPDIERVLPTPAILILDGGVFYINDMNNKFMQPAGAIIPGARADKSAPKTSIIYACIPQTNQAPSLRMRYYEKEAF